MAGMCHANIVRTDKHIKAVPICIFLALIIADPLYANEAQRQTSDLTARKFDEYPYISYEDHRVHIDRFVDELNKYPGTRAYVITYDARVSGYGDTTAPGAASLAKFFLHQRRVGSISLNRIVTIEGGLREARMVELYIVPRGAIPPKPTPTFERSRAIHCPLINVTAPLYVWETRSPLTFRASVWSNLQKATTTYKWSVSAGKITGGQGTPSVAVELADPTYQPISATVDVGGFSTECDNRGSATSPANLIKFPNKFDEFGNVTCEDELARLDNFAISLQSDPRLRAYIIVYGGRRGRRNEARARAVRMKYYLVHTRGLEPGRIEAVDGGYREELMSELWLSPRGDQVPVATPTLQPEDVTLKGRVRVVAAQCSYG